MEIMEDTTQYVTVEVINPSTQGEDEESLDGVVAEGHMIPAEEVHQILAINAAAEEAILCCHCLADVTLTTKFTLKSLLPQIGQQYSLALAFQEFDYTYDEDESICNECLELLVTSTQLKYDLKDAELRLRQKCMSIQTKLERSDNNKDSETDTHDPDKIVSKEENVEKNDKTSGSRNENTVMKDDKSIQTNWEEILGLLSASPEDNIIDNDMVPAAEQAPTAEPNSEEEHVKREMKQVKCQNADEEQPITHDCPTCGRAFALEFYLEKHVKLEHKFGCKYCRETHENESLLTEHMKIHENEEFPYVCLECDKKYKKIQYFDNHLHIHFGTFCCDKCGKCFKDSHEFQKHKKTHETKEADRSAVQDQLSASQTSEKEQSQDTTLEHESQENSMEDETGAKPAESEDGVIKAFQEALSLIPAVSAETMEKMDTSGEVCATDVSQLEACETPIEETPPVKQEEEDVEAKEGRLRRTRRSEKLTVAMAALMPKKRKRKDVADDEKEEPKKKTKAPQKTKNPAKTPVKPTGKTPAKGSENKKGTPKPSKNNGKKTTETPGTSRRSMKNVPVKKEKEEKAEESTPVSKKKSDESTPLSNKKATNTLKEIPCPWCVKTFRNTDNLEKHMRSHDFSCKYCGRQFEDGDAYAQHSAIHKGQVAPYSCPVCQKTFTKHSHRFRHMSYHTDRYRCHVCRKNFIDSHDLKNHGASHDIKAEAKSVCKFCLKTYEDAKEMEDHVKEHTEKPSIYMCRETDCMAEFSTCEELIEHLKTCEGYLSRPAKPHVPRQQTPGPKVKCDTCGAMVRNLESHMNMHLGVKKEPRIRCEICHKMLASRQSLALHLASDHSEDRPFQCHICSRGFKKRALLRQHMLTHSTERKYQCHLCHKNYRRPGHLKEHMLSHTQIRKFMCEKCSRAFLTKSALRVHMMIHDGIWKYKCQICEKKFRNIGCLKVHTRTHTGERPFICDQCGRGFLTKQMMEKHMTVHTGEKNYACSVCMRTFASEAVAKNHLLTHTDEKRFRCDICQKCFKMPNTLRKHKKRFHSEPQVATSPVRKQTISYVVVVPSDDQGNMVEETVTIEQPL